MRIKKATLGEIIAWCIYDWASTSFPILITTFIFAAYFTTKIASNTITGTHEWGNATALAGILIAIFGPVLEQFLTTPDTINVGSYCLASLQLSVPRCFGMRIPMLALLTLH